MAGVAAAAPPPGPPYPDAVTGQRVYDYAGVFSPEAIAQAQSIISGIEIRTGAQVAVYTQVKPESDDLDKANADALALMNQWGVGRKGFDDGLVILFDMQTNLRHGQVSLYAGSGYRAAFLSDSDRQAVFDNDMKPLLADGDLDGGLLAGLHDIDANATPEHAATLERARQINAVVALAGLLIGLMLILWVVFAWVRHGRDPLYIDDDSILMAAPPPDLTPAMATVLLADKATDRTVTAGLIDLAARGCIAFEIRMSASHDSNSDPDDSEASTRTGVRFLGSGNDALPGPEAAVCQAVDEHSRNHEGYISPARLYQLRPAFDEFRDRLERAAVERGWLTAKPSDVLFRWRGIGGFELVAAIFVAAFWYLFEASGLLLVAAGLGVAGIVTLVMARSMPARTRQGAMLYAMLSAYRRTMDRTLAQARSMGEVVEKRPLPWVTTPDQAMAWGIAFGLDDGVQEVMARSLGERDDLQPEVPAWHPSWWLVSAHTSGGNLIGSSGSPGHGGLFSASRMPNPGALMAALGSVTHASPPYTPSSSSGGSSFGGSFGGGGGGGGGGAGGGF
ncbi:MAG: TPM domain-containing protein [Candidatus Limnocylindrales bacterium]